MFAISGVTGQVGGAAARALLAAGQPVRAILRDTGKAAEWEARGAEVAVVASVEDTDALTAAFTGTAGAFVMVPPDFAPQPGYPGARAAAASLAEALAQAKPSRVIALSSIGGHQVSGLGLITQVHILEQALAALSIPTAVLRPAWVHGELGVGHRAGARKRHDGELPATARPRVSDDSRPPTSAA